MNTQHRARVKLAKQNNDNGNDDEGTAMITNSIFYLYFRTSTRFCHALMRFHRPCRNLSLSRERSFSIVLATAILSRETMNTTSRKVTEFIILIGQAPRLCRCMTLFFHSASQFFNFAETHLALNLFKLYRCSFLSLSLYMLVFTC